MKHFSWLFTFLLVVSIINYPNPFSPKTGEVATFEATAEANTAAVLYIYDMSARLLLRRDFSLQGGGVKNRLAWNGYSDFNELAGTGLYLYRLVDTGSKTSLAKGKVWVINK